MIREQEALIKLENERTVFRARILYIEDDVGLGRLLQKRLERMACMVDIARDGHSGLKMFSNDTYDVVITDYDMPGISGIEVLCQLKELTPVIILTGQGDEKVAVEAMKLGAADYVAKDIHGNYIELLPSIIDRVLERQKLINDRRQARAELQASEARYRAIVEDQAEMICRFRPGGSLTFANAAFCRYFGIRQADIGFQNIVAILPRRAYQYLRERLKGLNLQQPVATSTHSFKTVRSEIRWLQWTSRAIFGDTNKLTEYQLVGRDITEIKSVEEALRASEEKNTALLTAIPDPILRIDKNGTCTDVRPKNGQAIRLSTDLIGQNISKVFPPDVVRLFLENIDRVFQQSGGQVFQFQLRDGEQVSYQEARLVQTGADEVLAIVRDVTERTMLDQQLQYLSIHDSLTGLFNRAYFTAEVKRLETGRLHANGIVVCDVDGLKLINDNLGHNSGDKLLKTAADILTQTFRGSDAVCRIGGDEFAVLIPNATRAVLDEACERLRKNVAVYNRKKPDLFLSISVGAALQDGDCPELCEAFNQADQAMYAEKHRRGPAARDAIIGNLREFLERKEHLSKEHADRVRDILRYFGIAVGFSQERLARLDIFAEYHDIGKVALPESILANEGLINEEEYLVIKRHCEIGHRIAAAAPKLAPVADWILKHHERWDGKGYPLGICGEDIPLECRLLAIADAFESMTGGRYASPPRSNEEALEEIMRCAETQFDPHLAEIFAGVIGARNLPRASYT